MFIVLLMVVLLVGGIVGVVTGHPYALVAPVVGAVAAFQARRGLQKQSEGKYPWAGADKSGLQRWRERGRT